MKMTKKENFGKKAKKILTYVKKADASAWARLAALVISLVTLALRSFGAESLADEAVSAVTIIFAFVSAGTAYWKNNSFTYAAQQADKFKQLIKSGLIRDGSFLD